MYFIFYCRYFKILKGVQVQVMSARNWTIVVYVPAYIPRYGFGYIGKIIWMALNEKKPDTLATW
jgi:hypothetical protein